MKYSMEKSSEYLLEGAYKNREVVCASIFQSKMNVVFENESYSAPVGTNSWLMQLFQPCARATCPICSAIRPTEPEFTSILI
jgi:hypothetical protein